MSLAVLDYAKSKVLDGDFSMATSYYERAISEGVEGCAVMLRYLTKGYLVYPLEYEQSTEYFELIKELRGVAEKNPEYLEEYKMAVASVADIRRLFLRSISLLYYSDILVASADSVVLREIAQLQIYIKEHKSEILDDDVFELGKYLPKYNKKRFAKDLNVIEAYCMNILLSYTAEQHSLYLGKKYSATTVDYGYFYSTTVHERDNYYNYANVKPRLFLLGYEAYYHEVRDVYKKKLREIGNFDSPKELRNEIIYYAEHKDRKDASAKEFIKYAKQFEKKDSSRQSLFGSLYKISSTLNPLLKLNPFGKIIKNNIGSFELDECFPQKKLWGVCSMLAAGKGWKVDTVRYAMLLSACFFVGAFAYVALALAKKAGFYFGVNVEKP